MKKEFKFRAWYSREKKFIKGNRVIDSIMPVRNTQHGFALKTKFVLQQFIWALDKRGKEIYDGDILEYKSKVSKHVWRIQVIWNNGDYIAKWRESFMDGYGENRKRKTRFKCGNVEWSHFKIIGNILQNPDLKP